MLLFITGPGRTIWRAWKLGLKSGRGGRHELVIKYGETKCRLLEKRVTDQWSHGAIQGQKILRKT